MNINIVTLTVAKNTIYSNNVNFNPSIIHLHDNVFLVSFHTFRRGYGSNKVIVNDKYHPWYGGPNSKTWWQEGHGFRGTGLMIIKIINDDIIIHQVLQNINYGVDMRLLKTPSFIFATFNLATDNYDNWGIDRELYQLPKATCKEKCLSMQYFTANIIKKENQYILKQEHYSLLCPNLQDQDKNWSSFMINDQLYCSDYLTPKHTVIHIDQCSITMAQHINIMEEIELFYEGALVFSLSTPAMKYKDVMLGVGHLKIIPSFLKPDTKAHHFVMNHKMPKHPYYDQMYMMFLYTFSSDLEIISISPAFYPPETKHSIVFPAGLTYYDDYIVSYGEADLEMKLMFLLPSIIDDLLFQDIQIEYDFLYL